MNLKWNHDWILLSEELRQDLEQGGSNRVCVRKRRGQLENQWDLSIQQREQADTDLRPVPVWMRASHSRRSQATALKLTTWTEFLEFTFEVPIKPIFCWRQRGFFFPPHQSRSCFYALLAQIWDQIQVPKHTKSHRKIPWHNKYTERSLWVFTNTLLAFLKSYLLAGSNLNQQQCPVVFRHSLP